MIVCDEIFGISKHIMKPYARRKDLSKEEEIFNYRLSRARISIECAFGIITEKWQILQSSLRFSLPHCDTIICALIGLHNFVLYLNDPDDNHEIIEDYVTVEERNDALLPTIMRNRLKDYFSSPAGSVSWQEKYI